MEGLDLTVVEDLRRRYPAYAETAYVFVLAGLQYTLERLGEVRHVTGRELAEGCRDLALERWGPMSRLVLEHWGIRSTRDLGRIVFALVEAGILVAQPQDTPADFDGVYDFEEVFERRYPWAAPAAWRQQERACRERGLLDV
mgnify:CR=1 FL=1